MDQCTSSGRARPNDRTVEETGNGFNRAVPVRPARQEGSPRIRRLCHPSLSGLLGAAAALVLSFALLPWAASLASPAGQDGPERGYRVDGRSEFALKADRDDAATQIAAAVLLAESGNSAANRVLAMKWFLCAGESSSPATWPPRALSARIRLESLISQTAYRRAHDLAIRDCGIGRTWEASRGNAAPAPLNSDPSPDWRMAFFGPGSVFDGVVSRLSALLGLPRLERMLDQANERNPDILSDLLSLILLILWALAGLILLDRVREEANKSPRLRPRRNGAG